MFTLNCKGRLVSLDRPVVMGIINATPDSFYSGSRTTAELILGRAAGMIEEGAAIIDIGGQSTRPGSEVVEEDEELRRVLPGIEAIASRFPEQLVSIDTYYAKVAKLAIEAGAGMVNDISAGSIDEGMIEAVVDAKVPYVLTHMRGRPETMQHDTHYNDVTLEVFDFLSKRLKEFTAAGIHDIIIDPGFGFGKTIDHNFQVLRQLSSFRQLERPILVGLSRKATIYKTLNTTAEGALNGTTVLHTLALQQGASMLRAHDVREAMEVIALLSRFQQKKRAVD
jgi:dihydropteroate synthase